MAKKTKQIDNRIQSSEHVVHAATTHRDQVAETLAARALAVQGPDSSVTKAVFLSVLDFLVGTLAGSMKDLDEAEHRVVAERADDVGLREARDAAALDLVNGAVRVRSMVVDALGTPALHTYGLEGSTPRAPRELASHARTVANLMKKQPFAVTVDGISFDSAAMAATLDKKALALETALGDIQREEQELADKLGQRGKQLGAWTDDHQGIADTLVGLFRLAGRKDLAERVRPTSRALAGEEITPSADTPTSENPTDSSAPG